MFGQLFVFYQLAACAIRQLAVTEQSLNRYGQAPIGGVWLSEVKVDATNIGNREDVYAIYVRANKPAGI